MPSDFPSRKQLDDQAENFIYGQFEVFIPASEITLPLGCKTNYIVRMPQTLSQEAFIGAKQDVYRKIKQVASGALNEYDAIIEITYQSGCNLFFRTAYGKYIDYTGVLRPEDRKQLPRTAADERNLRKQFHSSH